MTNAARNGHVLLTVRRQIYYADKPDEEDSHSTPPALNGSPRLNRAEISGVHKPPAEAYEVVLQRKENEGFGFVILTSKNKPPPGVIPHKIGRLIEGSPADRCRKLKVGDLISAVNGQLIMELSHDSIVQLIKDAGNTVTLTVIADEEHKGPPSGTNSARQSPASQHRAVGQAQPNYGTLERNSLDAEGNKGDTYRFLWPDHKSDPAGNRPSQTVGCYPVELERGSRGFGFSLRGGKEYNMGLFILRLAEDGPAIKDGRIHVGDQIVEINGEPTQGITHTRAIELIQAGGTKVLLLLRPGTGLIPDYNELDFTHPPSPTVLYDDLPAYSSASHMAPGVSHLPESDGSVDYPKGEKVAVSKDHATESKDMTTLPSIAVQKEEMAKQDKQPSTVQHKRRERSVSPRNASKRNLLHADKDGSTRRGRSVSPRKSDGKRSKDHIDKTQGSRQAESKRTPKEIRERSVSPRKTQSKKPEGVIEAGTHGKVHTRGRSSSPIKSYKDTDKIRTEDQERMQKSQNRLSKTSKIENADQVKERSDNQGKFRRADKGENTKAEDKMERSRKEGRDEKHRVERDDKSKREDRLEKSRKDGEEKDKKEKDDKFKKEERREKSRREEKDDKLKRDDKVEKPKRDERDDKLKREMKDEKKTDEKHEKSRRDDKIQREEKYEKKPDAKPRTEERTNYQGPPEKSVSSKAKLERERNKLEIDPSRKEGPVSPRKPQTQDVIPKMEQAEKSRLRESTASHKEALKKPMTETADKTKDEGILKTGSKKITPGPWKVPGTDKITNADTLDL